jgi:hypothetical protein
MFQSSYGIELLGLSDTPAAWMSWFAEPAKACTTTNAAVIIFLVMLI